MHLDMKQINNLITGVSLAVELRASNENLRKFLTVHGYRYEDGKVAKLKKFLSHEILNNIYFELRCYEISVDYYMNNWDVVEDDLENEIYLEDIKGIEALEIELKKYFEDFSYLLPEWNCDNLL